MSSNDVPSHRIVILGAGRAPRHDLPAALVSVDRYGRVMDWLLSAFSALPAPRTHFVMGYKAGEIRNRYPDIDLIYNPDWETTGPATSLSIAPLTSIASTWVTYSDVLFRSDTVRRVEAVEADLVIAVDTTWRTRYDGRSRADLDQSEKVVLMDGAPIAIGKHIGTIEASAEFVGLVKLSSETASQLQELVRSGAVVQRASLPEVISLLMKNGARIAAVDVGGQWAELNLPQDLSRFVLGTKAESLMRLKPLVRIGTVGELVSFTVQEWHDARESVLESAHRKFGASRLIVRSSALSEDQWSVSSAGVYESVLDVDGGDPKCIAAAIERVLRSYGYPDPQDQVLIQEMLSGTTMSGVVMTRTPDLGAPYYVFSFDDTSCRTDTVTGGTGDNVRTVFLHRGDPLREELPKELHHLLRVVQEIEELVGHDSLDIEFAYTADGRAHVLQVRPIAVSRVENSIDDHAIAKAIVQAKRFFGELQRPTPFVLSPQTQLSVMSDWNPAEIIGKKPKRLAFSLYRYLITDGVWALQRAQYGYRDVRPCNLIVDILGHPYVDVRATFNSFVPAALPDNVAERLLRHYLDYLAMHPEMHDKVEFSVLFTCLAFDFDSRARERLVGVLSKGEIALLRKALFDITRNGMSRCNTDYDQISLLGSRFERIRSAGLPPLERAYVLLEDLRRYGTPLFSHLARAGFVAATFLRSLPSTGCIDEGRDSDYVAMLNTVSSQMQHDARQVAHEQLTWQDFVSKYGHLRPGTYDITSPCYASSPDLFLRQVVESCPAADIFVKPPHPWNEATRAIIAHELEAFGYDPDLKRFEEFLQKAIEGRELSKFVFTRNLSAALEAIAEFGEMHGVGREELAHISIEDLLKFRSARSTEAFYTLKSLVRQGEEAFKLTEAVCFPGQIFSEADMECFEQLKATPNFVTSKTVRASVVCLSGGSSPETAVKGKIVVIPNADPGFDWLFSRGIGGLVTMYGGRNSHMAIRSAEFGLPAAIGVGERLFETLTQVEVVEIDCGSQQIRVVR